MSENCQIASECGTRYLCQISKCTEVKEDTLYGLFVEFFVRIFE